MVAPIQTAFGTFSVFQGIPAALQTGQALDVLNELDGPAAFVLDEGHEWTRIVSCLLHGNEPSGLNAVAEAFEQGARSPHANMIYFVGNVRAAKAAPDYFTHRLLELPEIQRQYWDMNRIWIENQPPSVRALTEGFLQLLEGHRIEAVVDLHNTSGENPAHAIMLFRSDSSALLAGMHVDRAIRLNLATSLIGALSVYAPSVIIECGKMGLKHSDRVATEILERFLQAECIGTHYPENIYQTQTRVFVDSAVTLDLLGTPQENNVLSLRRDLDRLNFDTVSERTLIGYYTGETLPLSVNPDNHWESFFEWDDDGSIWLKPGHTVAMATANRKNIRHSCLFFLITQE